MQYIDISPFVYLFIHLLYQMCLGFVPSSQFLSTLQSIGSLQDIMA